MKTGTLDLRGLEIREGHVIRPFLNDVRIDLLFEYVRIKKGEHKDKTARVMQEEAHSGAVMLSINGKKIWNGQYSYFPIEWIETT